jgi:hypothetical protein
MFYSAPSQNFESMATTQKVIVEELHNLCFSPNIIKVKKSRRVEMGGTCIMHK